MGWFGKKKPSPPLWVEDNQGRKNITEAGQRQVAQWEAEGKVHQICKVHIIDPADDLPRIENWTVVPGDPDKYGEIDRKTYDQFRDEQGDIYAVIHYVEGKPQLTFAKKDAWDHIRKMSDKI